MTEAVEAVAAWLLDQAEIYRVWAICDVENQPSARVLEKSGFQREGILRLGRVEDTRIDRRESLTDERG